jgi:ABC-type transport system involved in multi-copper enzyme maturation permease subunit
MQTFFQIKTVARYESKTLFRSWFFRIFASIVIGFIIFFNIIGYGLTMDGGWSGRLLPGAGPYMNLFLLNVAQAIIAVFLSADFLGRDRKLDTSEAFYIRNISNSAYVLGKTLGILKVFLLLNLFVLLASALFSLLSSDMTFSLYAFLLYPLLISLPTLVFILGLSFFVMLMVRNQAITFVLLLGYIALTLFYAQNKLLGIWDFMAFYTPLAYSDFSGFFDFAGQIRIRSAYLLLGMVMMVATVGSLPRLPQEKWFGVKVYVGMALLLIASAALFGGHFIEHQRASDRLLKVQTLNNSLKFSSYKIDSYTIHMEHRLNKISCTTELKVIHEENNQKEDLVIALNPGLQLSELKVNDQLVANYHRDMHLIRIPSKHLIEEQEMMVEMCYSGSIDETVLYADVSDEERLKLNRLNPLVAGKQAAFITSNYVLLTRETNWYPVVAKKNYWTNYTFSDFKLEVNTQKDLQVISQGEKEIQEDGTVKFQPEVPLNALSVAIGNYDEKSVWVDSVEMRLYHHPKHTAFMKELDLIADTLPALVKAIKNDYERKLGIKYPFKRYSIVESSIHHFAYIRMFTLATDHVMPEMVFFPENGGGTWQNDFKMQKGRMERRNKRSNETFSPKENQAQLFKQFVGDNFIEPRSFFFGRRRESERNLENWGKHMAFPLFYSYRNTILEQDYPLMNISMENYLYGRQNEEQPRFMGGLNANDEVILTLKERSLTDLLEEGDEVELADVLAAKGNQLFSSLRVSWESIDFDRFIDTLLLNNAFTDMPKDHLVKILSEESGTNFSTVFENWISEKQTPAFLFGNTEVIEIKDEDRIRYFIQLPVKNTSAIDGIIEVSIREGMQQNQRGRFRSRFGGRGPGDLEKQSFRIKSQETVAIGFITEQEPRDLMVNTFLARNIPSLSRIELPKVEKNHRFKSYFEGMQSSNQQIRWNEPHEIVVDNEDENCEVINTGESNSLKDWWVNRQNQDEVNDDLPYQMVRFWNPPVKWEATAGTNFYGKYIKSAFYKRSGSGVGRIIWTADIKDSGNYDCYAYIPYVRRGFRGRDRGESKLHDFHFLVRHDDGDEEIAATQPEGGGWAYLGEFYFSEGQAVIELFDNSEDDMVFGDAVKWVKK